MIHHHPSPSSIIHYPSSITIQHPHHHQHHCHHHPSPSSIIHYPSSISIIHHHPSSSIIIHHHPSSSIIIHHHPSSSIIIHHHHHHHHHHRHSLIIWAGGPARLQTRRLQKEGPVFTWNPSPLQPSEHCFFREGLYTAGEATRGGSRGASRGQISREASRGFAARLWLRGVAFADACSTDISDVCALMQLDHVKSMRKGVMKAVKEMSFRTRGHGWASKGRSVEVGPRWLCGGVAKTFHRFSQKRA